MISDRIVAGTATTGNRGPRHPPGTPGPLAGRGAPAGCHPAMLAAILTVLLWALSSLASSRCARLLGGPRANRWRLAIAVALLAAVVHPWFGLPGDGGTIAWLLLSGLIGLGLGDLCMFAAYERIGARLTVLMTQCLAVPVAAGLEWIWLGHGLTLPELGWIALILAGTTTALLPGSSIARPASLRLGLWCGLGSAIGLGVSGVVTRRAFADATAAGGFGDGLAAAYLRNLGGLAVVLGLLLAVPLLRRVSAGLDAQWQASQAVAEPDWRRGWPWLALTTLFGPTAGVACYQWALITTQAAHVQAILATLPVVLIPLAWWSEGDRPTWTAVGGGALAVGGAIGLALKVGHG